MTETIIDIYCHIFPDRYFQEMTKAAPKLENIGKRLRGVTKLFDLDARFKEMDGFGDYRQIISLPNPANEDIAKVVAAVLENPEPHAGKRYRPTGPQLLSALPQDQTTTPFFCFPPE